MNNTPILHLLCNDESIYNIEFIKFINSNFDMSQHQFIIMSKNHNKIQAENVVFLEQASTKKCFTIVKQVNKSSITIIHGIFFNTKLSILMDLFVRKKKLVWMVWGKDLYTWKSKSISKLSKISDYVQYRLRTKIEYLLISFPPDENEYKKRFSRSKKCMYAHYPFGYTEQRINENYSFVEKDTVNIIVGNSANNCLNHLDVLGKLRKYSDEKIKVHIPLNYGNIKYGDEVEKRAKEYFGDKALCYRENMSLDIYIKLLWNMDIGIYDTDRQIALGNIIMLLYMGKKIICRKKTVLYDYLESFGVMAGRTEDVGEVSLGSLLKTGAHNKEQRLALEYIDIEKIREQWKCVFDKLNQYS